MLAPPNIRSVVRSATATVAGLRGAGILLNVAVAVLLGRILGVSDFGAYAAGIGLGQILATVVTAGGGPLVVRGAARYRSASDAALLRGVLVRTLQAVSVGSGVVVLGVLAVVAWPGSTSPVETAMVAGAALVPVLAVAALGQSLLQGLERMSAAFGPGAVGRPLCVLALLGILGAAGVQVSASGAVLVQGAAVALTLGMTWALVKRHLPGPLPAGPPPQSWRDWASSASALGLTGGLTVIGLNLGVTLAGVLGGGEDAGLLGAASRAAVVVVLLAWAAAEALQPVTARLHAAGRKAELQAILTRSTRRVTAGTLLAAAGAGVLADPLLEVFGPGFGDGAGALRWLCVAGVVNALVMPNMSVLTMTGHERSAARAALAGVLVTAASCALLIPGHGASGGAVAYVLGSLARNGLASWSAWTRVGLDTSVLGISARRVARGPAQP